MKVLLLALALTTGQEVGSLDAPSPRNHQFVTYAVEQQSIPAGKRAVVELRFQVEPRYHVNSHTPKSELLIPTRVEFDAAEGVKLSPAEYPAGKEYSFAFDPKEKLDVYTDTILVKLPLVATPGNHELHGNFKYQACDKAACYPPKTLPITVLFAAN